jgi:signal transduction histidine kinase
MTIELLESQLTELTRGRERVDALNQLAYVIREQEQWDRMLALAAEAQEIAQECGYTAGLATSLVLQGFVRYFQSEYQQAFTLLLDALALASGDELAEGRARSVLSLVHWSLGNFDEALGQAERSIALLRGTDDTINYAFVITTRAGILHSLGQPVEALAGHREAHEIFRRVDYKVGVARSLSGIGAAWLALGNPEEARRCHMESLRLATEMDHGIAISRALNDLGELTASEGDDAKAIEYHTRALEIRRIRDYRQAETTSLLHLGRLYQRGARGERALECFREGLAIAEAIGARPKSCQFHQALSAIYEENGQFAEALQHFKAFEKLNREIAGEQATLRHKTLELQSQLELHRLRNVELTALLDELSAAQAQLVNSEKMAALGSLVAALAHELNSPLGVIRSSADMTVRCVERLAQTSSDTVIDTLRTNARLLMGAGDRISTLVARLKTFAGIDQAEYTEVDIAAALDNTVELLEPELRGRISVDRTYCSRPRIHVYAAELNQVFMNLLRNAAQAIQGSGVVTVRLSCSEKAITIAFTDTGRGIPRDEIARLFNPRFTSDGNRIQAALSLFASWTIVQKHGGEIRAESEPGRGSTFTVTLPVRTSATDLGRSARA